MLAKGHASGVKNPADNSDEDSRREFSLMGRPPKK